MTTALALRLIDADDRLEIQLEPILLDGAGDPRDPFHFLVPQRRVAVLVEVHLVTAHVFRRVTGNVGGAHHARDVGTADADHDHADRTTHGRERILPFEAITFDRAADGLRDLQRTLLVTAFEQYRELVAAEPCQHVGRPDVGLDQV